MHSGQNKRRRYSPSIQSATNPIKSTTKTCQKPSDLKCHTARSSQGWVMEGLPLGRDMGYPTTHSSSLRESMKRAFFRLIYSSLVSLLRKAKSVFILPSGNQRLKTCIVR